MIRAVVMAAIAVVVMTEMLKDLSVFVCDRDSHR